MVPAEEGRSHGRATRPARETKSVTRSRQSEVRPRAAPMWQGPLHPTSQGACTAETIAMEDELLDGMEETDPATATETMASVIAAIAAGRRPPLSLSRVP